MKKSPYLFPYYVYEIASRLVVGVVGSKLEFRSHHNNYFFEVRLEDLLVAELHQEGFELLELANDPKMSGSWSQFLEGGPREISRHLLRKLSDAGIQCVDPDKPSELIKKT